MTPRADRLAGIDPGAKHIGLVIVHLTGADTIGELFAWTFHIGEDGSLAPVVNDIMRAMEDHDVGSLLCELGPFYTRQPSADDTVTEDDSRAVVAHAEKKLRKMLKAAAAYGSAYAIMARLVESIEARALDLGIACTKVAPATWRARLKIKSKHNSEHGSHWTQRGNSYDVAIGIRLRAHLGERRALLLDVHQCDAAGVIVGSMLGWQADAKKAAEKERLRRLRGEAVALAREAKTGIGWRGRRAAQRAAARDAAGCTCGDKARVGPGRCPTTCPAFKAKGADAAPPKRRPCGCAVGGSYQRKGCRAVHVGDTAANCPGCGASCDACTCRALSCGVP